MSEQKKEINFRDAFYISNLLSISRIFLGGIVVFLLVKGFDSRLILTICAVAVLTDYFDGYFARKFNQITELGKILDPLADKLAVGAVVITLIYYRNFPLWLAAVIVGRDVLILIAGLFIIGKTKIIISSIFIGKITVTVLSFLIIAYVIEYTSLQPYLEILAICLIVLSLISYCFKYLSLVKKGTE